MFNTQPLLMTIKALLISFLTLNVYALEQLRIESTTVPVYFDLEATIEAVNQSTVSAQTSGAVKAIHFDVNDEMPVGTLIITIDDTQQQAQLQQATANLEQAKAQNEDAQVLLKRNKRLYEQKTLSQGEYDSANARAKSAAATVKAAEAMLKQAKEQLAYTQVKAPYGGIVTARHVELGELVNPGQPLMTGMALTPLRAVADLPQTVAAQYKNAEQVTILVNDRVITPEQVTLFPYADARHHSVRLRATLPKQDTQGALQTPIYPGLWSKVRVKTGERETILVPSAAILQRSELSSIYVLSNGQPRLRQVRTGVKFNGQIEVLSGLQVGDTIVTDALAQLAKLAKGV